MKFFANLKCWHYKYGIHLRSRRVLFWRWPVPPDCFHSAEFPKTEQASSDLVHQIQNSAGSATAADPSAPIVALEQIPLQRLLSHHNKFIIQLRLLCSFPSFPWKHNETELHLDPERCICWGWQTRSSSAETGGKQQAFQSRLSVKNSARSDAHWFVLQQDSAVVVRSGFNAFASNWEQQMPPWVDSSHRTSDQPRFFTVRVRSVVGASETNNIHMLELPVIFCIYKNIWNMLQKKWHSNKGKTATKNPRINTHTPKNVATQFWHLNKKWNPVPFTTPFLYVAKESGFFQGGKFWRLTCRSWLRRTFPPAGCFKVPGSFLMVYQIVHLKKLGSNIIPKKYPKQWIFFHGSFEKYAKVKLERISPRFRGESKQILELPPPR